MLEQQKKYTISPSGLSGGHLTIASMAQLLQRRLEHME